MTRIIQTGYGLLVIIRIRGTFWRYSYMRTEGDLFSFAPGPSAVPPPATPDAYRRTMQRAERAMRRAGYELVA